MAEQGALCDRLKRACELAGYGAGGDTTSARKAIMQATGMSKMGVSKLFTGKSADITVLNLFLIAELLKVDARWLGTGFGDIRQATLPTDAQEVAAKLSEIQDPAARRAAIASARVIATDPIGQLARVMGEVAESRRWSPNVQRIAEGLEEMEDGPLKRVAIAWAMTAAFNPERLPRDAQESATPARRATDRRPENS